MRLRQSLLAFLAVSLSLVYMGCDSDGDNGNEDEVPANGTFEATLTGGVTKEITGGAFFAGGTDGAGSEGFLIYLTTSGTSNVSAGDVIYMVRDQAERPGNGTYTFVDGSEDLTSSQVVGLYVSIVGTETAFFGAESGTLRITESSDGRLGGSINFTGMGFVSSDPENETALTVTGSFTAVGGTFLIPPAL